MAKETTVLPEEIVKQIEAFQYPLTLESITGRALDIWLDFWLGPQTPQTKSQRVTALTKLLEEDATPAIQKILEEGDGEIPALLPLIRDYSQQIAKEERAKNKPQKPKSSAGGALHQRRVLAQKRRQTPPGRIH